MIAIGNVLISDQLLSEQFVCDLSRCKGACCVDGDAGAPLDKEELSHIDEVFDKVLPYLNDKSRKEIEKQGRYVYHDEFGWVTPTIRNKICVYGIKDEQGVVKCGIEQAFLDGKISWKKPLSCHLFPATVTKSKKSQNSYLNYEPREDHCKAACKLGASLKVPVFRFLKESLERAFGKKFYQDLEATYEYVETSGKK
jgi:hypothetical protein